METLAQVLVVDDDPQLRGVIRSSLSSSFHCDVAEAGSATEAMRMLEEREYELVVCDLQMGKESGMQVFHHLHQSRVRKTFFILFTGATDHVHPHELSQVIAVEKPSLPDLVKAIEFLGLPLR